MKKVLFIIFFLTFNYAQTGMLTPKGESTNGVWGTFSKNITDSSNQDAFSTYFNYMTTIGLELGLGVGWYHNNNEYQLLSIGYHYKNEKFNINISSSRKLFNDFNNKDEDWLWFNLYSNSALFSGIGGMKNDVWDFNWIKFGKIWLLESGIGIGFTYLFDTRYTFEEDSGYVDFLIGFKF